MTIDQIQEVFIAIFVIACTVVIFAHIAYEERRYRKWKADLDRLIEEVEERRRAIERQRKSMTQDDCRTRFDYDSLRQ